MVNKKSQKSLKKNHSEKCKLIEFEGHSKPIKLFRIEGEILFTGGTDNSIRAWSIKVNNRYIFYFQLISGFLDWKMYKTVQGSFGDYQ